MTNQRGPGCMATVMLTMLATLLLFALASMALRPDNGQATGTVERVLQPQASAQIEGDAQQGQTQRARIAADLAAERAREATRRLLIVGALVAVLALLSLLAAVARWWLRRPQIIEQRVTLQLPPGTPPDMIDAQWRIIDAQMDARGYELEMRK